MRDERHMPINDPSVEQGNSIAMANGASRPAVPVPAGRMVNRPLSQGGQGFAETLPPARRIPLATLEHVKREMGRVYRAVANGEIDAQQGTRQTYILGELVKVITMADLERRLLALEVPIGTLRTSQAHDEGDEYEAA